MPVTLDPEPIASASARTNVQVDTCPFCGAALTNSDACDRCDWVREGNARAIARHNPRDRFAMILSLFWPGAGHFYKGHAALSAVLAGIGLLCFLWGIATMMFFGFLVIPVFWVAVAASAYFAPDLKHPANPLPSAAPKGVLD
jgi:TM2 domain-containing membrane protein YozV